jgi:hypothetical protein
MINIKLVAKQIYDLYQTNPKFQTAVDNSDEPYRACIYESGLIANPQNIEGTPLYEAIVEAIADYI